MNHSPAFLCDIFSANSNSNKNVPGLYRLTGSLLVPEPAWTSIKNRPPLKTGHFEPLRSQPGIFGCKSSHPGNSASLWTFWDGEWKRDPFFEGFFQDDLQGSGIKLGHGLKATWMTIFGESTFKWQFLSQQNLWHKIRPQEKPVFDSRNPGVSFGAGTWCIQWCTAHLHLKRKKCTKKCKWWSFTYVLSKKGGV